MATVTVGIHLHEEPERLTSTLRALDAAPGRHRLALLLLPDAPDAATRSALTGIPLPQSSTAQPQGPPACFNRLAARTASDIVILLEAGCVPAPGSLDRLIDVMLADPRNGLAGPSTNLAWNEQAAFPGAGGDPAGVARTGREAARRFGARTQPLTALHSLADFCYAVRREVISTIGGADEGYGLGPCWEMEYNVRAARAGFRGLWVCGAYVYRPPFTARRRVEEARRFDASRRRYQDSVCALRLRHLKGRYEPHCRGESCEHFAPAGLIQIRRAIEQAATSSPPTQAGQTRLPLVSCIMPTRNRAEFALQAIKLFALQDYEARELIVVDDGTDGLEARLPADPRIRYVRSIPGESIGAKRNRACALASGEFIAQWDDDDWYGSRRLSVQLEPLLAGRADITGLQGARFFDLHDWRAWAVSDELHRRLFRGDVHGGTLVFARRVWERLARYPDASLAEDAALLLRATARGARLERLPADGLYVYLRHGANAWHLRCGEFLGRGGWRSAPEPPFPPADRAFYAARSRASLARCDGPLVSCIMPTADRRSFVERAIAYFERQDYPSCELLILDDGEDRVGDLVPADSRIRYVSLDTRLVLGDKRNRACEMARGDLIAHWDDDDWQAPNRLSYQVQELERGRAPVCGVRRVLFLDPAAERAWLYDYPAAAQRWVAGGALLYRRSVWHENRFAPLRIGEDTRFVWNLRGVQPLVLDDHRFFVAIVHPGNTSRKITDGAYWHPWPVEEVRALLGSDWQRYAEVRR